MMKKTIDTITKFVMVLLVLMGLVLVLMEPVMDHVGNWSPIEGDQLPTRSITGSIKTNTSPIRTHYFEVSPRLRVPRLFLLCAP